MASVQTNAYNGRYLKLTVIEESYSIANNTSTIRWTLESIGGGTNNYYSIYNCSVNVNGVVANYGAVVPWDTLVFPAKAGSVTGTVTIVHAADGTSPDLAFTLHGRVYYNGDENLSGSIPLTHIPRYADITSFTVSKVDETSVLVNYAVSNTIDYVWYSTDNGSSWAGLPSDNKINGLSAGSGYNFKIRVRRQDSQLTTDSGTYYQSTYPYPSINSTPTFTIGSNLTIGINNPLGRTCTVYIIGDNTASKSAGSTTGTSITGFTDAAWKAFLYGTIPRKTTAMYKVRLVVTSPARDTTVDGGNYSVIGNNQEAPTFTDFDWVDTDSLASFLTGQNGVNNPTILVAGLSDVIFTIPTSKKAISNFGADLKSYLFAWSGGISASSDYSSTQDITNHVYDGTDGSISVTAYDHRNQSKIVTKSGLTIIKPSYASCLLATRRRNGIETTTYLNGEIKYWGGDWANGSSRSNQLFKIEMHVNGGAPIDITAEILANSVVTTDNGIKTITLNPDAVPIHSNSNKTGGFVVGTAYNLSFNIYTGYSTSYYYDNNRLIGSAIVSDGKIGMSRYKDETGEYHYGLNGMPDPDFTETIHGSLKVLGLIDGEGAGGEYQKTVDLSTLDVNTYYPVYVDTKVPQEGLRSVKLSVQLNSGSVPSWSTHALGFSVEIDTLMLASGWGTTDGQIIILKDYYGFATSKIASITQLFNSSRACFYLRGGGKYHLFTDWKTEWVIATTTVTLDNQTIAPVGTLPANSGNINITTGNLLDKTYPVGTVYTNATDPTSPAIKFGGGTWVQLLDRFLVGAGSSYGIGATGGSSSHTHTSANHSHSSAWHTHGLGSGWAQINHNNGKFHFVEITGGYTSNGSGVSTGAVESVWQDQGVGLGGTTDGTTPGNTGSTTPGDVGSTSNLPPWRGAYMWYRSV